MKRAVCLFLLSACLLMSGPARAEPPVWKFDPPHCGFYFDIRHIFSTVRGQFDDFSGSIAFDPENLDESAIDIRVEVASVDTNVRRRDDHLRSEDFFHVSRYPEMTFQSTEIRALGGDRYEATGTFRIKDVSREITVPFTFHGVAEGPLRENTLVAGFDARFTIDRLAYNVGTGKFYDLGVTGKMVEIILSLEMIREGG
ncbi:MAG: YceI family protein [Deltaproteobacteria bacterium]|nr:YceI family protein [Deltaproteobacteria bacterium]